MTPLREYREPDAREAEENLRVIRELMERPTKHSTFSGLSGILAGVASIVGCAATRQLQTASLPPPRFQTLFLAVWAVVVVFAVGMDYLLTKRRAARIGKRILSRLGKQMAMGSLPGLGAGAALTLFFLQQGLMPFIYPVWMLCYGVAVCAVGLFSQREVKVLGAAFLLTGALTLFAPSLGLAMMAVAFGGFHIVYALTMARRDGW